MLTQRFVSASATLLPFELGIANATAGAVVLTLPEPKAGRVVAVRKGDGTSNTVTALGLATLTQPGETIVYRGNGSTWAVVAHDGKPPLVLLYGVDFASLTNQTLVAGTNTIDGKAWWLKGALRTSESLAIVNGQGLRMRVKSSQLRSARVTGAALTLGFFGYMGFGQLAGYSANKPTFLQWRWQDCNTDGTCIFGVGLWACALSSTRPTDAERQTGLVSLMHTYSPPYYINDLAYPGIVYSYQPTLYTSAPLNQGVMQLANTTIARTQCAEVSEQPSVSSWPSDPRSFYGENDSGWQPWILDGVPKGPATRFPTYGAALWNEAPSTPSVVKQGTLRALRVLQPLGPV